MKMSRILSLLVVCTAATFAQYANPRITVFGAGSFVSGDRVFLTDDNAFSSGFDKGGRVGVRGTVDLTDSLGAEVSYSFARNNLSIRELERPPLRKEHFDTHVHQLTGNLLYYFASPDETLRPFVTGGIGWTRFSPTEDAQIAAVTTGFIGEQALLTASNRFSFNFGGGFQARIYRWLGVQVDVRDHVMEIPRFGLPQRPVFQRAFFPVSGMIHNVEAAVGGVFYLP
jgi:hypothetical protein